MDCIGLAVGVLGLNLGDRALRAGDAGLHHFWLSEPSWYYPEYDLKLLVSSLALGANSGCRLHLWWPSWDFLGLFWVFSGCLLHGWPIFLFRVCRGRQTLKRG